VRQLCKCIALAFFLTILAPPAFAVESPDNPAAAIQLILDTRQNEIRSVDSPSSWWHDTKERAWSVKRLVEPGILDTTHTFIVTYRVDGVALASWRVDTSKGTAVSAPQAVVSSRQGAEPGKPGNRAT
jgi:hypothetical protein